MSWMTPEQRNRLHRQILYIRAHDPIAPKWYAYFVYISVYAMSAVFVVFMFLCLVALFLA